MASPAPLRVEKATVLCYRIYEIAEEIDLERARKLISEDARRLKLGRENSQYLEMASPPLAYELGRRPLALRTGPVTVDVTARLFEHGSVSIILRVPVPATAHFDDLIPLADELYDSQALEELALELLQGVRKTLAPACQQPHLWDQNESYTVVFVERFGGDPSADEVMARCDVARLLLGETSQARLAEREAHAVTASRYSYTDHDLAVVDWNSAFVYEPSGSSDIPDVLEIANAQLLEFRYYDDLLDEHLKLTYDQVQRRRRGGLGQLFRSPYRGLARQTLAFLMDLSEFVERVENSLKIIGDFYLAKVYEAGVRRLRIPQWEASVTRKQALLFQTYSLLKGEVDTDRALTLEATIVLLIVAEIFFAFAHIL